MPLYMLKLFHHNIRKFIKNDEFLYLMNNLELRALTSNVDVVKKFLVNRPAENYKEFVTRLLKSLQDIGANTNLKAYFFST